MRYLPIAFLFFISFLLNCKTRDEKSPKNITTIAENNILNENNLPRQVFMIDLEKDNSLITKSGVIVQIPKGSLQSDKNPVSIEIKEAIDMKDIFLAGL